VTTDAAGPGGTDEALIRRIAHMLDLADDTRNFEGERESSREMAFRLMARLGIDEALVRSRGLANAMSDPITVMSILIPPPFSDVQANWFGMVAETMGCKAVINRERVTHRRWTPTGQRVQYQKRSGPATLRLFGRKSVVERAIRLVRSLNVQCIYALAQFQGQPGVDRTFRRSYVAGFGAACRARMAEINGEELATMNSQDADRYALVRQGDAALIDAAVHAECGELKPLRQRLSSDLGWACGESDGRDADLGHARLGTDRVAIGNRAESV
jgi:hypothetical protein